MFSSLIMFPNPNSWSVRKIMRRNHLFNPARIYHELQWKHALLMCKHSESLDKTRKDISIFKLFCFYTHVLTAGCVFPLLSVCFLLHAIIFGQKKLFCVSLAVYISVFARYNYVCEVKVRRKNISYWY